MILGQKVRRVLYSDKIPDIPGDQALSSYL